MNTPWPVPIAYGSYAGGASNGDKIQTASGCTFIKEGTGQLSIQLDSPFTGAASADLLFLVSFGIGSSSTTGRSAMPGARSTFYSNDLVILTRTAADAAVDCPVSFVVFYIPKQR